VHHSTLGWTVIIKKKKKPPGGWGLGFETMRLWVSWSWVTVSGFKVTGLRVDGSVFKLLLVPHR